MEDDKKVDLNTEVANLIGSLQMQVMVLQKQLQQAQEEIAKLKHGKHLSKTV